VALITEDLSLLGHHEAHFASTRGIPSESRVRMNILGHLDRTIFGEGELPQPRWIGWYGAYR